MKKTGLFILILSLVIIGFALLGYFKAVPGLENQGEDRPQIEIMPKSFDFGSIDYGVIAKHDFKLKNIGKQLLEITRVATSCACTSAKVGKETINPGEETELSIEYNTGIMGNSPHAKGDQERIIYVKSNDPINPQTEVTIHAYVK